MAKVTVSDNLKTGISKVCRYEPDINPTYLEMAELSFEERFALLVERQWTWKENRALNNRLKYAGLKLQACLEDLNYRHPRGLTRSSIDHLATCQWVQYHQNCIITGPTGAGKTFIGCALAHHACREGYRAIYFYVPKLFRELAIAQVDGRITKLFKKIAKAAVLVIDDWGLATLSEPAIPALGEIGPEKPARVLPGSDQAEAFRNIWRGRGSARGWSVVEEGVVGGPGKIFSKKMLR